MIEFLKYIEPAYKDNPDKLKNITNSILNAQKDVIINNCNIRETEEYKIARDYCFITTSPNLSLNKDNLKSLYFKTELLEGKLTPEIIKSYKENTSFEYYKDVLTIIDSVSKEYNKSNFIKFLPLITSIISALVVITNTVLSSYLLRNQTKFNDNNVKKIESLKDSLEITNKTLMEIKGKL